MSQTNPLRNRILARLPRKERDWLGRWAEVVTLAHGEVVCDPGRPLTHAYFPNGGILSSVIVLEGGAVAEVVAIGNEGMAGGALLVDATASPQRVVQQVQGELIRIPAAAFREAVAESAQLHELVLRYLIALLQQCGQNLACNTHHCVRQRTCRWLLAVSDRVGGDQFAVTQEYLAQMLGVRRQTVGVTAQELQQAGLLSYRRGHMTIHNRQALEDGACECYRGAKEAYERVMEGG
jgi:CRP-like cAMP-binding protein